MPAVKYQVKLDTIHSGFDRKTCWVHARAGAIPGQPPAVVLTMQMLLLSGSDVFYALNEMRSDDLGRTWAGPVEHATLARRKEGDIEVGVCDFTPKWHAKTGKLLGIGQSVHYRDNRVMDYRHRQTAWSVYDPQARSWAEWRPKYVRLKKLADDGALGRLTLVKQSEKHDGPHAPHFWDVERSGGGVAMDMGCHAIEFFRWMLGKPRVLDVYAEMGTHVHADKTRGDDNALLVLNFEGGVTCVAEESWTKPGGMDDRAEVYGSGGVAYADLLQGNAILAYSAAGYDYAVEKAGATKGWSFPIYEEAWNYGFPQEMDHFVRCVADGLEPLETGEDGRAVLEILFAAYRSAATGRKVKLPFRTRAAKPYDLWQGGRVQNGGQR